MSQSYADRHLETALQAMLEQKVNENRSSMRYWPAISDRLGEQVSRRPWEYVMDTLNRPRISLKPQYVYTAGAVVIAVLALLLLVVLINTDDGSSGESVPASAPESQNIADDSGEEAVVAPAQVPVTSASILEPGSEEAQILTVLENQVQLVNARDYEPIRNTCTPNGPEPPTVAQLKHVHEETGGPYCASCGTIVFSPEGFNLRNVEIKLLRSPFGQATADIFEYDEFQGNVSLTFEKVDGQWYSESTPCRIAQ